MGSDSAKQREDQPLSIAERAARRGVTFEEEVDAIVASGRMFSRAERVEVTDRIRAMTPKGVVQTDSTLMIRRMRDSNYGRD
jgi:hypothetical protein